MLVHAGSTASFAARSTGCKAGCAAGCAPGCTPWNTYSTCTYLIIYSTRSIRSWLSFVVCRSSSTYRTWKVRECRFCISEYLIFFYPTGVHILFYWLSFFCWCSLVPSSLLVGEDAFSFGEDSLVFQRSLAAARRLSWSAGRPAGQRAARSLGAMTCHRGVSVERVRP